MTATENQDLVVSFKLAGESNCHICGAARIKVDGHGGLTVYNTLTGATEEFKLADLQAFAIHPMSYAGRPV
jgi:hypothetical protein